MKTNQMTISFETGVWKWSIVGFGFKKLQMKSDQEKFL